MKKALEGSHGGASVKSDQRLDENPEPELASSFIIVVRPEFCRYQHLIKRFNIGFGQPQAQTKLLQRDLVFAWTQEVADLLLKAFKALSAESDRRIDVYRSADFVLGNPYKSASEPAYQ